MESTSELKDKRPSRSINVLLGEVTKYIELPNKAAGMPPKKFVIYPLRLKEIARIESYSQIDFVNWQEKNPFAKLSVLMYALFLSVNRNKNFEYTQEEFEELFEIADTDSLFRLLKVVLEISGLENVAKKEEEGNGEGAA